MNRVAVTINFSSGISCMSKAEWLGVSMKCSETLVGLDLETGLSTVLRCSLKCFFSLHFVSTMY